MKNLTLRFICLTLVAILSLVFVACDKNTKDPADSSSESSSVADTSDTVGDTSDTVGDTSDTASDTESDTSVADTAEPTDGTGLRAIKGTVDAFIADTLAHRNLKLGDAYAMLANCGGSFKGLSLYLSTYDYDHGDTVTVKVYAWNTDYATTTEGTALVDVNITGFENNKWRELTFDTALEAGEYLVVITGTSEGDEEHDYGCAIWTQASSPFVTTFINGEEAEDAGVYAKFIVE